MTRNKAKGSWVLKMKCVVYKSVVCDDCTQEEAENDPWEHAVDETETEQVDWEVLSAEPNC